MNAHKATLLRLLHSKSDIGVLLREGLLFTQITQLLGELIQEGLVSLSDGGPALTVAGVDAIHRDLDTGIVRGDGGYIVPMMAARIDKLTSDDLYLPPKRNSHF